MSFDWRNVNEAKSKAVGYQPTGLEVPSQPLLDYTQHMYLNKDTGRTTYENFNTVATVNEYTDWFKNNNSKHPTGFEFTGQLQLHKERVQSLFDEYLSGKMGYEDFLMKSYGYDVLKAEGHDVTDPMYWYKKYSNMDFSNPLDNNLTLSNTIARAHKLFTESGIDDLIYQNNPLFEEVVTGATGTAETMAQLFGPQWEEIKREVGEDEEAVLRAFRSTSTQVDRFSSDGQYYIHTDGKIYEVTEDPNDEDRDKVFVKYNDDGTLDSITINKNEVFGNVFLDGIISGSSGFIIDLGKTVSQLLAGVYDVTIDAAITGEFEFDKTLEMGLVFEDFKNSNMFTAKAYHDMDGFEANNLTDWGDVLGEFTGMMLGMAATAAIGSGVTSVGTGFTKGGKIARGVGRLLEGTGKVMQATSNVYNGSITSGINNFYLNRIAFAATHASKDALQTFTNLRLAGRNQDDALKSAGAVMALNTGISFVLASGAKDDTWKAFGKISKALNKYAKAPETLTESVLAKAAHRAGLITAGLDLVDNYLTMSYAAQMEQTGDLNLLSPFTKEGFDARAIIMSGLMAKNAYHGAKRSYRSNISIDAPMKTWKVFETNLQKKIKDAAGTQKGKDLDMFYKELKKELYNRTAEAGDANKEQGMMAFLDMLHERTETDGTSTIMKDFADIVNAEQLETYKVIYKQVDELNLAYANKTKDFLGDVMDFGLISTLRRGLSGQGIRIADYQAGMDRQMKFLSDIKYQDRKAFKTDIFSTVKNESSDFFDDDEGEIEYVVVSDIREIDDGKIEVKQVKKIDSHMRRLRSKLIAQEKTALGVGNIKPKDIAEIDRLLTDYRVQLENEVKARSLGKTMGGIDVDKLDTTRLSSSIDFEKMGQYFSRNLIEPRTRKISKYFETLEYDYDKQAFKIEMKRGDANQGEAEYKRVESILHMLSDVTDGFITFEKDGIFYVKATSVLGPVEALELLNRNLTHLERLNEVTTHKARHEIVKAFAQENFQDPDLEGKRLDYIIPALEFAVKEGYLSRAMAIEIAREYSPHEAESSASTDIYKLAQFANALEGGDEAKVKKIGESIDPKLVGETFNKTLEVIIKEFQEGKKRQIPWTTKLVASTLLEGETRTALKGIAIPEIVTEKVDRLVKDKGMSEALSENREAFFIKGGEGYLESIKFLVDKGFLGEGGDIPPHLTKYDVLQELAKWDIAKPKDERLMHNGVADEILWRSIVQEMYEFHNNESTVKSMAKDKIIINLHDLVPSTVYEAMKQIENYFAVTSQFNDKASFLKNLAQNYRGGIYKNDTTKLRNEIYLQQKALENIYRTFDTTRIEVTREEATKLMKTLGYTLDFEDIDTIYRVPGVDNGDAEVYGIKVEKTKDLADVTRTYIVRSQGKTIIDDPFYTAAAGTGAKMIFTNDTILSGDFVRLAGTLTDEPVTTLMKFGETFYNMKKAKMGAKSQLAEFDYMQTTGKRINLTPEQEYREAMLKLLDVISTKNNDGDRMRHANVTNVMMKDLVTREQLSKYWDSITETDKHYVVTNLNLEAVQGAILDGSFTWKDMVPDYSYYATNPTAPVDVLNSPMIDGTRDYVIPGMANESNQYSSIFHSINQVTSPRVKQFFKAGLAGHLMSDSPMSIDTDGLEIVNGALGFPSLQLPSNRVGDIRNHIMNKENPTTMERNLLKVIDEHYVRPEYESFEDKVLSDKELLLAMRDTDDVNELWSKVDQRQSTDPKAIEMLVRDPESNMDEDGIYAPITPWAMDAGHVYHEAEFKRKMPSLIARLKVEHDNIKTNTVLDSTPESRAFAMIEQDGFIPYHRLVKADEDTLKALRKVVKDKSVIDNAINKLNKLYNIDTDPKAKFLNEVKVKNESINHPSIAETSKLLYTLSGEDISDKWLGIMRNNALYNKQKEQYNNLWNRGGFEAAVRSSDPKNEFNPRLEYKNKYDQLAFRQRMRNAGIKSSDEMIDKIFNKLRGLNTEDRTGKAKYLFLDGAGNILEGFTVYGTSDNDLYNMLVSKAHSAELYGTAPLAKYIVTADENYRASAFEEFRSVVINLDKNFTIDGEDLTYRNYLEMKSLQDFTSYIQKNNTKLYDLMTNPARKDEWETARIDKVGPAYRKFVQLSNKYISMSRSTQRKTHQAALNLFENNSRAAMEIVGLMTQDYRVRIEKGEVSGQEFMLYKTLNFNKPEDNRIANHRSGTILEQIINGINKERMTVEQKIGEKISGDKFLEYAELTHVHYDEREGDYVQGINPVARKLVNRFVNKAMTNMINKTGGIEEDYSFELNQLQTKFNPQDYMTYLVAKVIERSESANATRIKLAKNYGVAEAYKDFNQGFKIDFSDTHEITGRDKKIVYLDLEALVRNFRDEVEREPYLSVAYMKPVRFYRDSTGDYVNRKHTKYGNYRFALDEAAMKDLEQETFDNMIKNGEDIKGLQEELKKSYKLAQGKDDRTRFIKDFNQLIEEGYTIYAHNGQNFDFSILKKIFGEELNVPDKQVKDSINLFRDLVIKGGTDFDTFYTSSRLEDYGKTFDESFRTPHNAEEDVQAMIDITTKALQKLTNIRAEGGQAIRDVEDVLKLLGLKLKGDQSLQKIINTLDTLNKTAKIHVASDTQIEAMDFFGLNKDTTTIARLQRMNEMINNIRQRGRVHRDLYEKLGIFNYDRDVDESTLENIKTKGLSNLNKLANFLTEKGHIDDSNFDKVLTKIKKEIETMHPKGQYMSKRDFNRLLLDNDTYTDEFMQRVFQTNEGDFTKYNPPKGRDNDIYTTRQGFHERGRELSVASFYRNNVTFNNIFKVFNEIEGAEQNNDFIQSRIKEAFSQDIDGEEYVAVDRLDLIPEDYYSRKARDYFKSAMKDLVSAAGLGPHIPRSEWGNVSRMGYNFKYNVYGDDEPVRGTADTMFIGLDKAINTFGIDVTDRDDGIWYGYGMGYPSDNNSSVIPIKIRVLADARFGNNIIADESLMKALQRDFDGDKYALFFEDNPAKEEALAFLNEIYTKPFQTIRKATEEALRDGKQKRNKYAMAMLDIFNDKDSTYYTLEEEEFKNRAIAQYTLSDKEADGLWKTLNGLDMTPQKELDMYFRTIYEDQIGGVVNKDTQMFGELAERWATEYDETNILKNSFRRMAEASEILKAIDPEHALNIQNEANRQLVIDMMDKNNNQFFWDLQKHIGIDPALKTARDNMRKLDALFKKTFSDEPRFAFFEDIESKSSPEDIIDFFKNTLNISDESNPQTEYITEFQLDTDFQNKKNLRVMFIDMPEDGWMLTKRGETRIRQNKLATHSRPEGYSLDTEIERKLALDPETTYITEGQVLYVNDEGKKIRSNIAGRIIDSGTDFVTIRNNNRIGLEGNKISLGRSAAGKLMQVYRNELLDIPNVDIIVSSKGWDPDKSQKITVEQLEKHFSSPKRENNLQFGGENYETFTADVDTFFIENIDSWRTEPKRSTSTLTNNEGAVIDLMGVLANAFTPFGKVQFKGVDFNELVDMSNKYKSTPLKESDMSLPLAYMRFQAWYSLLDDMEKAKFNSKAKTLDSNVYLTMDRNLPMLEAYMANQLAGKDLDKLIIDRYGIKDTSSTFRAVKALLSNEVYEALYPKKPLAYSFIDGKIESKRQRQTEDKAFVSEAVTTSKMESEYQDRHYKPVVARVGYAKFHKLLGMYTNMKEAADKTKLGMLPIGKHYKGSPQDGYGKPVSVDEAIPMKSQITTQPGHGDPKGGLINDGIVNIIQNKRPMSMDEIYEEGIPAPALDARNGKLDSNPFKGQREYTIQKALGNAIKLADEGELNNADYTNLLMRDVPVNTNQKINTTTNSLNFSLDPNGQLVTKPVMNSMMSFLNLGDSTKPVGGGMAGEYISMQRTIADRKIINKYDWKPITKVEMNRTKKQLMDDYQDLEKIIDQDKQELKKLYSAKELLNEYSDMELEDTPSSKLLIDAEREGRLKGIYSDKPEFDIKRDPLRLTGSSIKKLDGTSYKLDTFVNDIFRVRSYEHQKLRNKILMVYGELKNAGKDAQAEFKTFNIVTRYLNYMDGGNNLDNMDNVKQSLMKALGVTDESNLKEAMEAYVDDYGHTNSRLVSAYYDAAKDMYQSAREAGILAGEPLESMYLILSPVFISKDKNFNKHTLKARMNVGFSPTLYDNIGDFRNTIDMSDPFKSMDRLAKDIASTKSMRQWSRRLIEEKLIENTKTLDFSYKYVQDKFVNLTPSEKEKSIDSLTYAQKDLRTFLGSNARVFENAYARYLEQDLDEFEAHIKAMDDMTNYYKERIADVITVPEQREMLNDIDSVVRLRDVIEDVHQGAALEEYQRVLEFRNHSFRSVIRNMDTKDFKQYLIGNIGSDRSLVDEYGRSYDNFKMYAFNKRSFEFLRSSIRLASNEPTELLLMALEGHVFQAPKKLTELVNKHYFVADHSKPVVEALRKAGRIGNRWIMGNPIKLLSRFERFTFTDSMMAIMANPKTIFELATARKELSAHMGSNGKATTPMLETYLKQRGNVPGMEKFKEVSRREEDIRDPFNSNNLVSKVLDTSLDVLNMQHDLVRYALFRATMNDINNTGDIQGWGAARGFKDYINTLDSPEERAYRVVGENIATFGEMPFITRALSPWLVFTTYALGQVRWAGNWGLSLKHSAEDFARGHDRKGAMKNMMSGAFGVAGMYAMGNLIYSVLADMFDVDEETEQEWKDERYYMELFGTLIQGSPTQNYTPGMPAEALWESWADTLKEGIDKGGVLGVPSAYFNKLVLARANPGIKIPAEALTGKNFFTATPIDDKYDTNFIENFVRRAAGLFVGTQTVNAFIDNQEFAQYRDEDKGAFYDIMKGMKNAIASEYGNSRAYKKDQKDFYKARSLVYNQLDSEGYFNYEPSDSYNYQSDFDEDKAAHLKSLFRTAMRREEPVSTLYNIAYEELQKGTSPSTIHSALNAVSIYRLLEKLDNRKGFMASLTDKEQDIFNNAMRYEMELFPGLKNVNLYQSTGSSYIPDYIPYNPYNYMPYEYKNNRYQDKDKVRIYPSMGGYYNKYDNRGLYQRWRDNEKGE